MSHRAGRKKCSAIVLILALFCLFPSKTVAASPVTFSEDVHVAQTIVFEVGVTDNSRICGLSLEVHYSAKQVKVKGCEAGEILSGGIAKSNSNITGKVLLTYISTAPLTDEGAVLRLEFEALSTNNREIDIDCKVTECVDVNCDNIQYEYTEAIIKNPRYVETTVNQTPLTSTTVRQTETTSSNSLLTEEKVFATDSDKTETTSSSLSSSDVTQTSSTAQTDVLNGKDDRGKGQAIIIGCVGIVVAATLIFLINWNLAKRRHENEND